MPQNFNRDTGAPPSALRQSLGFVPRRQLTGGFGVTVDEGAGTIGTDPATFPVPALTFGVGVPGGAPANGALYFDTTAAYVGYVGNGGTWHAF